MPGAAGQCGIRWRRKCFAWSQRDSAVLGAVTTAVLRAACSTARRVVNRML
jgi:hypothetical protein